jgi:hypothetical protein
MRARDQRTGEAPETVVAPERAAPVRAHLHPGNAAALQRAIGNAAVARLIAETGVRPTIADALVELGPDVGAEASPDGAPLPGAEAAPATEGGESVPAVDGAEKTGEGTFVGAAGGHAHAAQAAPSLDDGPKNEFGEIEGELTSDVPACLFVDGGRTGEGIVHWAGGDGGVGNQGVGDITLVAPVYEGADPSGTSAAAKAWIRTGTGTATVTRSFRGVVLGANGTYWFTARARARADVHERLHVAASRRLHDAHIAPLERRIAQHTGEPNARSSGTTRAEAIAALQTFIDWNASVQAFRTDDTAANTPMGTVDAADLRAADFIRDYGARRVNGVRYAHYMDQPPGPAAAPRRRGGGP